MMKFTPLVAGTDAPFKVGEVRRGMMFMREGKGGWKHDQPFKVLGVATREDYVLSLMEYYEISREKAEHGMRQSLMMHPGTESYFYFISTD